MWPGPSAEQQHSTSSRAGKGSTSLQEAGVEKVFAERVSSGAMFCGVWNILLLTTVHSSHLFNLERVMNNPTLQYERSSENGIRYEVTISSMSDGMDGAESFIEGVVELTEYVSEDYVSRASITTSVVVDRDTPLRLIEARLLNSTIEALKRAAGLSEDELRGFLETTRSAQANSMNEDDRPEREGAADPTRTDSSFQGYDATRDPRTGRPPSLLEARRLGRQTDEDEADLQSSFNDEQETESTLPDDQRPARMASPEDEDDPTDALIKLGVSREQAAELIDAHGTNLETLKAAAFVGDTSAQRRKDELAEHHETGIPPLEPPQRDNS